MIEVFEPTLTTALPLIVPLVELETLFRKMNSALTRNDDDFLRGAGYCRGESGEGGDGGGRSAGSSRGAATTVRMKQGLLRIWASPSVQGSITDVGNFTNRSSLDQFARGGLRN